MLQKIKTPFILILFRRKYMNLDIIDSIKSASNWTVATIGTGLTFLAAKVSSAIETAGVFLNKENATKIVSFLVTPFGVAIPAGLIALNAFRNNKPIQGLAFTAVAITLVGVGVNTGNVSFI